MLRSSVLWVVTRFGRICKSGIMKMSDDLLQSNCAKCAALCCVSLAFDKSPQFKIDKAAGEPCPNLGTNGTCTIHEKLGAEGFKGCAQFECLGAGQRVTQELFDGQSWQQKPELLKPMMDAFSIMRRIHEQIQLLQQAANLLLPAEKQVELQKLAAALQPDEGWTEQSLAAFVQKTTLKETGVFLRSLKEFV